MIAKLVQLVHVTSDIVYRGYYCSLKTGQFLVNLGTILHSNLLTVIEALSFTLQIVTESFAVFFRDISTLLQEFSVLYETVTSFFANAFSAIQSTVLGIYYATSETVTAFYNIVQFLIATSIAFIALCKHFVVLFGLGAWWAITFVPLLIFHTTIHFVDSVKVVFYIVSDSVTSSGQFIRDVTKEVYHFVTDVPVESTLGILLGACLLYLLLGFYKKLYVSTYRTIRYIVIRARRKWINLNFTLPSMLSWQSQPKIPVSDETACIICQERPKCVLLLPCRHVCLCTECNRRVQFSTNTCPICRDTIDNTMKVFI